MEFQDIIYTKEEGIATITLNRPETMNAITARMTDEWLAAIEDAKQDNQVKVLTVTGAGRAFCAGLNPREIDSGEEKEMLRHKSGQQIPCLVAELDKPYIAAINGPAAGGGMDMASMCDIRIASDRARFSMAFIRMGITPGVGGCYFLTRIIGIAKACELIWTGKTIDAQEALRIGYVSKVVPHEELATATRELATQIAKGPSVAIQLDKRLIYNCLGVDLDTALQAHYDAGLLAWSTEDAKEGPRAWVEKREPIFKGR